MADTKASQTSASKPLRSRENPTRSIGGSLAAMYLVESVREGNTVEVPSLGIRLRKRDAEGETPSRASEKH